MDSGGATSLAKHSTEYRLSPEQRMSRVTVTRVVLTVCTLLALSAPALAQIDLTGSWNSRLHDDWKERSCGHHLGDYTGIGINDESRPKALARDTWLNQLRERQCLLVC